MGKITKSAVYLARASKCNPVISTATIMLFFVMFNILEGQIEFLFFGERFEHWLDPFFAMLFMAYSAYAVHVAGIINEQEKEH